jgi:hypothetical protein
MPKGIFKNILISTLVLLFIGAGLPKMYAGSVLLSKRISLTVQKQTIEKILHLVETKAKIQFMYNPQMFNLKKLVSVSLQNSSLQEVLQVIINNKELVFYEMGKYIVITNKHEAPVQANAIVAFSSINLTNSGNAQNPQLLVDTIHFYDTVKVTKTETKRIVIQDTVKIYDTITKIRTQVVPQTVVPTEAPRTEKTVASHWFAEASFAPLYADMLPQNKWIADLSLSAQASVGYKRERLNFSVGVGGLWQHGASKNNYTSSSYDSVIQRDTVFIVVKYKTGDYYYIVGADTIHKVVYDSTKSAVPRQWYKTKQHEKNTETTVGYSVYWVIIPCKIEYEWALSKKMNFGLGLSVSPAFAIKKYGQLYDPKQQKTVYIAQSGIASFALFSSLEPSFSYSLSKNIAVQFTPIVQFTVRSLMSESAYYFGGGARFGIRKIF